MEPPESDHGIRSGGEPSLGDGDRLRLELRHRSSLSYVPYDWHGANGIGRGIRNETSLDCRRFIEITQAIVRAGPISVFEGFEKLRLARTLGGQSIDPPQPGYVGRDYRKGG